jgi:hypothetical protein
MSQRLVGYKWLLVMLVALFSVLALAAACGTDDEDAGETATATQEPTDGATVAPTDAPTDAWCSRSVHRSAFFIRTGL